MPVEARGVEGLPGGAARGVYALTLELRREAEVELGGRRARLGPGAYVYVGSACGPGGLAARLARHLAGRRRRPRWHVDRLLEAGAEPVAAAYAVTGGCREAESALAALALAARVLRPGPSGFGSSDDPLAPTHLFECVAGDCVAAALALVAGVGGAPGVAQPIGAGGAGTPRPTDDCRVR